MLLDRPGTTVGRLWRRNRRKEANPAAAGGVARLRRRGVGNQPHHTLDIVLLSTPPQVGPVISIFFGGVELRAKEYTNSKTVQLSKSTTTYS